MSEPDKSFTVKFRLNDFDPWEEVFPGLTGDYEWAEKVSKAEWNRNGSTVLPAMMRIYEAEGKP